MSSLSRDRLKEIALLYLMHGDAIEGGLEIPLFGENSGVDLTYVPLEKVKRDAVKLVAGLGITMVEAVDFIRTVSSRKFIKHSVEAHQRISEDNTCCV